MNLIKKKAGIGVGSVYMTLVGIMSLLAVTSMIVIFGVIIQLHNELVSVANIGARVAATTQNQTQITDAVQTAMQTLNLPTIYNGNTLFSVSNTTISNAQGSYLSKVTVNYDAPILFPNAIYGLGQYNSPLPPIFPISASAVYFNENYAP